MIELRTFNVLSFECISLLMLMVKHGIIIYYIFSVPDPCPCHFKTDLDPALIVSVFQDANKIFFLLLITLGTFKSVFNDNKSLRSRKTVEIRIRIHTNNSGSESGTGRPKNLRIRIRNTKVGFFCLHGV
jgi:hypothetical protein